MNKITLPRDFIYEFDLDKTLVKNYYEKVLASQLEFNTSLSVESTRYAYPIPYDEHLINEILRCANEVANEYLNVKLKICDIWLTKSEKLQVSKLHSHCLSIFSGVLYLNDSDTETIFTVPDEFMSRNFSFLGTTCKNVFEKSIRTTPQCGKLLIWPSYLKHRISPHKTTDLRYSVAFNTFLDGVVSTQDSQRLSLQTQDPEYL